MPAAWLDSVRTYLPWLQRAGGDSPHIQPWWFYLQRLAFFHPAKGPVWTEGLIIILALYAAIASFRHRGLAETDYGLARFLSLHTVLLASGLLLHLLQDSLVPAQFLDWRHSPRGNWGCRPRRSSVAKLPRCVSASLGILLAGRVHLAVLSWQTGVTYAADRRNPYVYCPDLAGPAKPSHQSGQFAEASPEGANLLLKVIAAEAITGRCRGTSGDTATPAGMIPSPPIRSRTSWWCRPNSMPSWTKSKPIS